MVIFLVLTIVIILFDQWTKLIVTSNLGVGQGFEAISDFVNIVHARNPGAAFGILAGVSVDLRHFVLIGISVTSILFIIALLIYSTDLDCPLLVGYSMFVGGATGNLIDRLRYGEVVDFLDVHWGAIHWPAFNVADSALCLGAGLFLVHAYSGRKRART